MEALAPSDLKTPYCFGRFEVHPATRQLLAGGETVALGARAFDVLVALIERRDRIVGKDELLELVWPGLVVEENNLQVQISTLRKLLGPNAISTIPGRGYRFTCDLDDDTARTARKSWWPAAAGIALACLIAVGTARFFWTKDAPVASVDAKAIAVLPFANISIERDNGYFADGVHEDLLTQLAAVKELKVISRTSVAEYRNSTKNARQIGDELRVATLVEGSVRREGNRVRITAQLIDARTDKHLWAESYDRDLKDIFSIQSDIATEIARALKIQLTVEEQGRLTRKPTENLLAYELYLRHNQIMRDGLPGRFAVDERIKLLERALELDPKFALAWAHLASDLAIKWGRIDTDSKLLARARNAAQRAAALAPDDLEVQTQVAWFYYWGDRDYERAARHLEALLRTAPNYTRAIIYLSWVRRREGRWMEASALLERALAIDARHVGVASNRAFLFMSFRQLDAAWAAQRLVTEIQPGNIEARCWLHVLDHMRSGSFAAYDAWRAALSPEAARSPVVWERDLYRAMARRDWDTAERFLESVPDGWRSEDFDAVRVQLHFIKGEREQGITLSEAALAKSRALWIRQPANLDAARKVVLFQALRGERDGAIADYARYRNIVLGLRDIEATGNALTLAVQMHALLGDRDEALKLLSRHLTAFASSPAYWRTTVEMISLWDDAAFQAILNDPANNQPMPITDRDPAALGV